MSERPKNVPIPIKQRLAMLQTRVAPLAVFVVAVLMAASLWRDAVSPGMLVGEVAVTRARVSSPVAATLERLQVQPLQMVKTGDIIAELRPTDPRQALDVLQNQLALLRVEEAAQNAQQDAVAAQRREALDFARLRLDWMSEKVALAQAAARATQAGVALELARGLTQTPGSSKRYLQEAELAKQAADAEVAERRALVETMGKSVTELTPPATTAPEEPNESLQDALKNFQKRLHQVEQSLTVITLRAPMDGMVTVVEHREGESVVPGDPVVVITSAQPERIVGYLRQPFPLEPEVGMAVEVRSRGRSRLRSMAMITHVGVRFEPIINPALSPPVVPEVGLPIEVSLPPLLRLRPGEQVSLVIQPAPRS